MKNIYEILEKACNEARSNGWIVEKNLWIDHVGKQCCPLGALLIQAGLEASTTPCDDVATLLCITYEEVSDIINGVDDNSAWWSKATYDLGVWAQGLLNAKEHDYWPMQDWMRKYYMPVYYPPMRHGAIVGHYLVRYHYPSWR